KLAFAPLRAALGSVHTLYLSPDGELSRVPFESLVAPDDSYLIERYRFDYLTTARDLVKTWPETGKATVVFAAPDYELGVTERAADAKLRRGKDGSTDPQPAAFRGQLSNQLRGLKWTPLPGSEAEARDIAEELTGSVYGPVNRYLGKQALEEVFKSV